MTQVLLVDDEPHVRNCMRRDLVARGHEVDEAASGRQAQEKLRQRRPAVVVCDLIMNDLTGLEVFDWAGVTLPDPPPFVLISAYGKVLSSAVGQRKGLTLLAKPMTASQLASGIRQAMKLQGAVGPTVDLGYQPVPPQEVQRISQSSETVLLLGESGVGKTRLAEEIHRRSPRSQAPFVKLSGAELRTELASSVLFGHERGAFTGATNIQRGAVEAADGGTLFIDEVGELDPSMQAFLLRFLDDRTYQRLGSNEPRRADLRIIAATNRDLEAEVRAGHFRKDLYYRLAVVEVTVPPLRTHRFQIGRLLDATTAKVAREHQRSAIQFSSAAREHLLDYDWPGNLRQLDRLVRNLSARHDPRIVVEPKHLSAAMRTPRPAVVQEHDVGPFARSGARFDEREDLPSLQPYWEDLPRFIEVLEYRAVLLKLRETGGVLARAARELGYRRPTLHARLRIFRDKYGDWPPFPE